ncbi:hypothetical protein NC01_02355 [Streptococcus uberis]|nr:hypothetical protein NC01_02355 [Streptococcus uberis]
MGMKGQKEGNDQKYDAFRQCIIGSFIMTLFGICLMILNFYIFHKAIWNSTTHKLLLGGLFQLFLLNLIKKTDRNH